MPTFYLVRHAHAHWTPDENRPLSAQGQRDAQRVADILHGYPIGAIYTSPFQRARQTIEPLAAWLDLPLQIEPDLRERRLGDSGAVDFFAAVARTWADPSFAFPDGESNAAAQRRGLAVVHRLQERETADHIVLSTHGNLLALILQGFDPAIDFDFWQTLTMPDVNALHLGQAGAVCVGRLWSEVGT